LHKRPPILFNGLIFFCRLLLLFLCPLITSSPQFQSAYSVRLLPDSSKAIRKEFHRTASTESNEKSLRHAINNETGHAIRCRVLSAPGTQNDWNIIEMERRASDNTPQCYSSASRAALSSLITRLFLIVLPQLIHPSSRGHIRTMSRRVIVGE
jgi:hypothetical protein